jgi:glycine cleavage system H protein
MSAAKPKTLHYKRSHFVTQLPVDHLYSPAHSWIARQPDGTWRVGLTKFATRMLGEMVDHGFDTAPGARIACGQVLGWVEGFKAISDVFCIADGEFLGVNPLLKQKISTISKDPYQAGWLYAVRGTPDPKCTDVETYRDHLDRSISRILEKQKGGG